MIDYYAKKIAVFFVILVGVVEDGQRAPKEDHLSCRYTKEYQVTAHFLWPVLACFIETANLIAMGLRIADKPWITESSSSSVNTTTNSAVNAKKRRSLAHDHNYTLMIIVGVVALLWIFHILCLALIYAESKGHFKSVGRWVKSRLINEDINCNLLLHQLLLILVLAHFACLEYILTMDEKYYFSDK